MARYRGIHSDLSHLLYIDQMKRVEIIEPKGNLTILVILLGYENLTY